MMRKYAIVEEHEKIISGSIWIAHRCNWLFDLIGPSHLTAVADTLSVTNADDCKQKLINKIKIFVSNGYRNSYYKIEEIVEIE